MDIVFPDKQGSIRKLKRLCATRWCERIDSIASFADLLPAIVTLLTQIVELEVGDVVATASGFLKLITTNTFVYGLALARFVLTRFAEISADLQSISSTLPKVFLTYSTYSIGMHIQIHI